MGYMPACAVMAVYIIDKGCDMLTRMEIETHTFSARATWNNYFIFVWQLQNILYMRYMRTILKLKDYTYFIYIKHLLLIV